MRRALLSQLAAPAVVLVLAVMTATGCGSGDSVASTATTGSAATSTSGATTTSSTNATPTTPVVVPTAPPQAALATGRMLDALARAYAPVTARINFVVAAEVLWRDAVDNDGSTSVQRDRAGALRVEILRMKPLLITAQRALRSQVQTQPVPHQVQTLLLTSIANRGIALQRLQAVLDASGNGSDDAAVDQLDALYRTSWNAAARATRDATNAVQNLRASLGLAPAPEEALR